MHGLGVVVRAFAVLALLVVGSVALLLPGAVSVAPVPAVSGAVAVLLARSLVSVAGPVPLTIPGVVVVAGGVLVAALGLFAAAFGRAVPGVLRVLGLPALGDGGWGKRDVGRGGCVGGGRGAGGRPLFVRRGDLVVLPGGVAGGRGLHSGRRALRGDLGAVAGRLSGGRVLGAGVTGALGRTSAAALGGRGALAGVGGRVLRGGRGWWSRLADRGRHSDGSGVLLLLLFGDGAVNRIRGVAVAGVPRVRCGLFGAGGHGRHGVVGDDGVEEVDAQGAVVHARQEGGVARPGGGGIGSPWGVAGPGVVGVGFPRVVAGSGSGGVGSPWFVPWSRDGGRVGAGFPVRFLGGGLLLGSGLVGVEQRGLVVAVVGRGVLVPVEDGRCVAAVVGVAVVQGLRVRGPSRRGRGVDVRLVVRAVALGPGLGRRCVEVGFVLVLEQVDAVQDAVGGALLDARLGRTGCGGPDGGLPAASVGHAAQALAEVALQGSGADAATGLLGVGAGFGEVVVEGLLEGDRHV